MDTEQLEKEIGVKPVLMTVANAAEKLGVNRRTFYQAASLLPKPGHNQFPEAITYLDDETPIVVVNHPKLLEWVHHSHRQRGVRRSADEISAGKAAKFCERPGCDKKITAPNNQHYCSMECMHMVYADRDQFKRMAALSPRRSANKVSKTS
jgi:hypothetical protein